MNAVELKSILDKHAKWLFGEEGGARAYLEGAYLEGSVFWPTYGGARRRTPARRQATRRSERDG
jgi:hypothetical protein